MYKQICKLVLANRTGQGDHALVVTAVVCGSIGVMEVVVASLEAEDNEGEARAGDSSVDCPGDNLAFGQALDAAETLKCIRASESNRKGQGTQTRKIFISPHRCRRSQPACRYPWGRRCRLWLLSRHTAETRQSSS